MIVLKDYQDKAVNRLIEDTYSLLKLQGVRHKMVLKAPTGAGKTVTMAAYINRLCEELPDKLEVPSRNVAFIWIAPNQLHLQSYQSLKNYFSELRSIKPIQFEDIVDKRLHSNEVLFLNWQSINKDSNVYVRENEQDKTLINFIDNSKLEGTEIIVILDEAHLFASKGKSAKELLQKIQSKIEIDVSATPLFDSDYGHTIKRPEVVSSEMIKKGVILNPALDEKMQQGKSINQLLLEQSLKKRQEIQDEYKSLGIDINPLLLIQLPNDNKTTSAEDFKIKEEVEEFLKSKNITTKNNRLGIWLSNEKINLDDIEESESITDVLLFKQAIALGWNCPRAAVLLIFREIQQQVFTIQTVGRILRMPEQKHYSSSLLNHGYVYTNLSRDIIQIVKDDMDYIVQNMALRIEAYNELNLKSFFINTRLTRNRLGSKFRLCLYESAEEVFDVTRDIEIAAPESISIYNSKKLTDAYIELDVKEIKIPLPKDVTFSGERNDIIADQKVRFAKTRDELDILFRQFCRSHVGGYAKADSTPVLELALKLFFSEYLEIDEYQAIKVILYNQNTTKFIDLIDKALGKYKVLLQEEAAVASKRVEVSTWDVPPERIYNEYYIEKEAELHALQPFYEYFEASNPEKEFSKFLDNNMEYIRWWYKNGEKNKEDFAVTYEDSVGITRAFYVDFIIEFIDGTVALFDTKTLKSDSEIINKHNALIDYIDENSTPDNKLIGGVIIPRESGGHRVWKFSKKKLSDIESVDGWISFEPSNFRQ